jgi:ribonuclease BN (tRNA processing enzyme)
MRLALTHFDARIYHSLPERQEAQAAARAEFPAAFAACDDMRIEC